MSSNFGTEVAFFFSSSSNLAGFVYHRYPWHLAPLAAAGNSACDDGFASEIVSLSRSLRDSTNAKPYYILLAMWQGVARGSPRGAGRDEGFAQEITAA